MRVPRSARVIAIPMGVALIATIPVVAVALGIGKPITVSVDGTARSVAAGTTLGQFLEQTGVRAPAGNLLDIDGNVLRPGTYPGRILLNGREHPSPTVLTTGDLIDVVHGDDRTEPVTKSVIRVAAGEIPDPQFSLATAPGEEIVLRGSISGEIASATFRPAGPLRLPREVALTFDDGPSPTYTPKVLAILRRFHVPATFFVVGIHAQRYPDLVRDEVRAGMAIGDHSWDHPNWPPFAKLGSTRINDEIRQTEDYLLPLGVVTGLFRPPGGSFSPVVIRAAQAVDDRVVLWDVDPKDWMPGRSWKGIVQNVAANVHAGSIVELHDGGGNRSATVRALPGIIRAIEAKHLQLVAIGS
jgi:peptidoglycan-N-acetylglucosamine deacetylase